MLAWDLGARGQVRRIRRLELRKMGGLWFGTLKDKTAIPLEIEKQMFGEQRFAGPPVTKGHWEDSEQRALRVSSLSLGRPQLSVRLSPLTHSFTFSRSCLWEYLYYWNSCAIWIPFRLLGRSSKFFLSILSNKQRKIINLPKGTFGGVELSPHWSVNSRCFRLCHAQPVCPHARVTRLLSSTLVVSSLPLDNVWPP